MKTSIAAATQQSRIFQNKSRMTIAVRNIYPGAMVDTREQERCRGWPVAVFTKNGEFIAGGADLDSAWTNTLERWTEALKAERAAVATP